MPIGVFTRRYVYEGGLVALIFSGVLLAHSSAYVAMSPVARHYSTSPESASRPLVYISSPLWRRSRPSQRSLYKTQLFASLTPEQEQEKKQLELEIATVEKQLEEKTALIKTVKEEITALHAKKKSFQLEINKRLSSFELTQETALRSLVKACSWRFVAALITLSTSLFFSRNAAVAASIVSSDFLSKAGTMYIGERVWNKVSWGKKNKGDSASRSVIKAVAWRAFAMINTLIVSFFIAKSAKTAGQIASADTVIKTTLYVVHERIWDRIEWGKQYDVEFNI